MVVELTTSRVDKGTSKFAPNIKPKAARRKPNPGNASSATTAVPPASTTTDPPPVEEESDKQPIVKRKRSLSISGLPKGLKSPVLTFASPPALDTLTEITSTQGTLIATPTPITVEKPPKAVQKGNVISIPQRRQSIAPPSASIHSSFEILPIFTNPEINIETATMTELITHPFPKGKKSKREEARLLEIKEARKRKRLEDDVKDEVKPKVAPQPPSTPAEAFVLVDGQLVFNQASLQMPAQQEFIEEGDVIEEDAQLRYVTSASFRRKHKLSASKWTEQMTAKFYDGLSYFGTDMKMISYMFPGMTHKHIKLKFKQEESKNHHLVTRAIRERKKAPPELRQRILASIDAKRTLENAQYVNRPPDSTAVKREAAEGANVKAEEESQNEEDKLQESEVEEAKPKKSVTFEEPIQEKLPVLELKAKTLITSGPAGPKARRKKKVFEDEIVPEASAPVEDEAQEGEPKVASRKARAVAPPEIASAKRK
ncbi:Transcription factor TFIIIB component B [Boothiomyces sp. JEL0866]|nr:Transcription factor TFIIIB component B [Boothiomyces sp. JEL0866]